MKTTARMPALPATRNLNGKHPAGWLGLILACALGAVSVSAQSLVQSVANEPLSPPVLREQAPPPPLSTMPAPPPSPYRLGPILFHPRISYRQADASGLPAKNGDRVDSQIRTFTPGLAADLGSHWTLDYSPSWVAYSNNALADSTEQSANLSGAYTLTDWAIQLTQGYAKTNRSLVETAQQTELENWSSKLSAVQTLSPKWQLQYTGGIKTRYSNIGPDIRSWSGGVGLNYVASPRLSVKLTPSYTYHEIAGAPDAYDQSLVTEANWQILDKLMIALGGGVQNTRSTSSTGINKSSPLLNLSLGYHPFETTSLTAAYSRAFAPSYFRNQATEDRQWTLSLSQRLLGRLYLNTNYSHQDRSYTGLTATTAANRADQVKTYNFQLSTKLTERLSLSASWQKTRNSSSVATFDLSSRQYGAEISYRY